MAAFAGAGGLSGAGGYAGDWVARGMHADQWSWAGLGASAGLGAVTAGFGRYVAPEVAARWKAWGVGRQRAEVTRLSNAGDIDGARAILEPHVRARDVQAVIDRLDVSSPRDGAVFWSGAKDAAQAHAADIGGVTLETTPGGRVIDNWQLLNDHFPWEQGGKELWGGTSTRYAQGATGRVRVVQSEFKAARGGGDIWKEFEYPELLRQQRRGRVTDILPPEIVPDPPR